MAHYFQFHMFDTFTAYQTRVITVTYGFLTSVLCDKYQEYLQELLTIVTTPQTKLHGA
jgi:hypothetical protein